MLTLKVKISKNQEKFCIHRSYVNSKIKSEEEGNGRIVEWWDNICHCYFPLDVMYFLFDLIVLSAMLVLEPIDMNTRFKCLFPNFISKIFTNVPDLGRHCNFQVTN